MIQLLRQFGKKTFSSLTVRNYRLYFIGRGISHCGDWMQTVALGWLVLDLTGSGGQLGVVLAVLYLPFLLGGPFAGSIAERYDKRRIMYVTQFMLALLSLTIGVLVWSHLMQIWMLYGFALLQGIVNVFDQPTRQTFLHDMVGREHLRNAVTLMSTEANLARAIGPMVAGALIASLGTALCFVVNGISFFAVIAILALIRKAELHVEHFKPFEGGLFSVFEYVGRTPLIANILLAIAIIGTLSYEFQVSLPLLARGTFHGTAADYAALLSAMGIGSVAGGLFAASRQEVAVHEFVVSGLLFGLSIIIAALMPTLGYTIIAMIVVGFFSINLTSVGNTMVQLSADPAMRVRVMTLWATAIFGSTLIGAPIVGYAGQYLGPRYGLLLGGIAAIGASAFAGYRLLGRDAFFFVPAFIRMRAEEEEIGNRKI